MKEMEKAGYSMLGVEPEKKSVEIANAKGLRMVNTYFEDFETQKKFDAIFCWHTLEHFVDINSALKKANSLLKPEGLVFIIAPNIERPYGKLSFFFTKMHPYYFSKNTLHSFLLKCGFKDVSIMLEEPHGLLRCVARKDEGCKNWLIKDCWIKIVLNLYIYQVKYYIKRAFEKLKVSRIILGRNPKRRS